MASKGAVPVRVVLVTLNSHLAGAFEAARSALHQDLPGLELSLFVASDWPTRPERVEACRAALADAHIVLCTMLFTEETAGVVEEVIAARRDQYDAVACLMCAPSLTRLTRLGRFTPSGEPAEGSWSPVALLRRLGGQRGRGTSVGERQMQMLRTLPRLLRFIPGTAQDLRTYLLLMQYWLAASDVNLASMIRLLVHRHAAGPRQALRARVTPAEPEVYPETGVYHPDLPGRGLAPVLSALRLPRGRPRVGVLLGRSYLLAGNTAHYDAMIRALEARGLAPVPCYASGLDARPAIEAFLRDRDGQATVEALVSLTGFSLVGGPAYNDPAAAQEVLGALDVPYLSLQPLEFQAIGDWEADPRGLNPLQATLQVAIPELDGAIQPHVFGGAPEGGAKSVPVPDRVEAVAARVERLVRLRRTPRAERKIGVVLFNFPPNAGNTGSAAYLAVFPSLQRVLASLKEAGYTVELPTSADDLRTRLLEGNAAQHGTPANVHARVAVEDHVREEPHLADIEAVWGPAPGKSFTDGGSLFILGARFGNVFVGIQPPFGWEGDPMRLLFQGGFAPTHAFSAFYRWMDQRFGADVLLHFGTHGALEFMPGKQVGLSGKCWPDRLIGAMPNVYLYASNNPSEGTLAKRRGGATLVSYLTPPITNAGLYRELLDVRQSLERFRTLLPGAAERDDLARLIQDEAVRLELAPPGEPWDGRAVEAIEGVRQRLLELEQSLIPVGLHTVGEGMAREARVETLAAMASAGALDQDDWSAMGCVDDDTTRLHDAVRAVVERDGEPCDAAELGLRGSGAASLARRLAELDQLLGQDQEISGLVRGLDGRYVPPVAGGDLLRSPAILPTGRNLYGFDPYRVPSAFAMRDGRKRADALLARYVAEHGAQPTMVACALWGTDTIKTEGAPLAMALALIGAIPRFDAVGRLAGATLVPLADLGRPRVDVVTTVSGVFRDLLPLQLKLLAEAAALAAAADEPAEQNPIRAHALADMAALGVDLPTAALRVFSNADGTYGSNVNLLVESGRWNAEDELAEQFVARKSFGYAVDGGVTGTPALYEALLGRAQFSCQNLDSVELGTMDIDQYVESLGGMHRVIERRRGATVPSYLTDYTGRTGVVRTLGEQVALETRTRTLNPKWYEGQLAAGYEGVRNIASRVTTALGWSATTQAVPAWVYQDVAQTFVLDEAMRERLARLNPTAVARMAERLLEVNDRGYWRPDQATLDALRQASDALDDRLEGISA